MKFEIKRKMRTRSQMIKGLTNVLKEDAAYICSDVKDYDLIGLSESIKEAKETIQSLMDHIMELEYDLYLLKSGESK